MAAAGRSMGHSTPPQALWVGGRYVFEALQLEHLPALQYGSEVLLPAPTSN